MKKILLSLAVGLMALTACTSNDVVEEGIQSNVIRFRNVVNKNSRALNSDNFGLFYVYGYYTKGNDLNTRFSIYTDTPVTKGEDGDWTTSIKRYWIKDATYNFYAYSCENTHIAPDYGGPSIGQFDGVFRLNYSCHAVNGISHDLLFTSATGVVGKEKDNQPVPFQFKHILSKINLKFVSEFPEDYELNISNISISQFQNTGTFTALKKVAADGTIGSWSEQGYDGKVTNLFSLSTVGETSTSSKKDEKGDYIKPPVVSTECYLIPYHYTTANNPVKIQFDLRVINPNLSAGNQTILSNTLTGTWHPNWRIGTAYTYIINLSGSEAGMEEIKFGVGIDDWNNPKDDNNPEIINISIDYKIENQSGDKPVE